MNDDMNKWIMNEYEWMNINEWIWMNKWWMNINKWW